MERPGDFFMKKMLLKNVMLNGALTDVLVEGNRFAKIAPSLPDVAEEVMDCTGLAILPPYYNGHTHAAMALLRGYADDYDLFDWLSNHIWPLEAKLTEYDVYIGTKLACLEMIKSGTVFFNDMYWFQPGTIRAADEMGMRADVGVMMLSGGGNDQRTANDDLMAGKVPHSDLIRISMAPHAIYTVSGDKLKFCADFAKANDMPLTTHLAETKKEFDDCMAEHGMTPTAYLDSLGLLTDRTTLAHSVWMTDDDFKRIADSGAVLVHNPVSNCKLASGTFNYPAAEKVGCRVVIGTDGNASNNNVSMIEEVKMAALLAKNLSGDPKMLNAQKAFDMATVNAAKVFGVDAGIAEGKIADFMLVDLNDESLIPGYNLISDMVYSAGKSCIHTVVCNGRVLMKAHHVPGEDAIISESRAVVSALLKR